MEFLAPLLPKSGQEPHKLTTHKGKNDNGMFFNVPVKMFATDGEKKQTRVTIHNLFEDLNQIISFLLVKSENTEPVVYLRLLVSPSMSFLFSAAMQPRLKLGFQTWPSDPPSLVQLGCKRCFFSFLCLCVFGKSGKGLRNTKESNLWWRQS